MKGTLSKAQATFLDALLGTYILAEKNKWSTWHSPEYVGISYRANTYPTEADFRAALTGGPDGIPVEELITHLSFRYGYDNRTVQVCIRKGLLKLTWETIQQEQPYRGYYNKVDAGQYVWWSGQGKLSVNSAHKAWIMRQIARHAHKVDHLATAVEKHDRSLSRMHTLNYKLIEQLRILNRHFKTASPEAITHASRLMRLWIKQRDVVKARMTRIEELRKGYKRPPKDELTAHAIASVMEERNG